MSATVFLFALLCLNLTPCVSGGKILVWPSEFSHWLNVKVILDKLIERGNDVTVVTHSATPSVNISPASGYNVEVLQVPHTKQDIKDNLEAMLKYWTHEMTTDTILQASQKLKELSDTATNHNLATCRELFSRVDLLEKWKKEKFDAVLADPGFMCGELLAQKLGLPLILSLRYSFGHTLERLCGQIPAPPSYVPAIGSEKTDKMDFMQRLRNIIFYGAQDILFYLGPTFYWDPFYSKVMELVPRVSSMRCLVEPRALLLLFISVNVRFSRGGNVLVLPGEYSHWHNMRNILDELLNRNHTVTVLLSSSSPSINITQHERYEFLVFETPLKPNEMHSLSEQLINIWMQHPKPSRIRVALQILDLMGKLRDMHSTLCDAMLRNEELISRLSARKFHLLFYDPMFICSDLLAEMLGLPLVLSLRFSLGFSMERMCGQMPSPVSYVPVPPTVLTDHMSFPERVQNMISYLLYTSMFRLAAMSLDNYYTDPHFSTMISTTLFVFGLLFGVDVVNAGNILVMPGEYSHWHNMRTIVDELVNRNHSVTVLVSSSSPTVQHMRKEKFIFNVYRVNTAKEEADAVWKDFINLWMNDTATKFETVFNIWQVMSKFMIMTEDTCKGMFREDPWLSLRDSKFEVLLSDPMIPCADVMAHKLKIPHVLSIRATIAYTFERFCGQMPAPPSYVPAASLQDYMTDHMSFLERVENVRLYIVHSAFFKLSMRFTFDRIYSELWVSHSGKVLVLPGEYSHWHNMRTIVDALVKHNHSVTVLVSSSSPTVQHSRKERFDYNVFKVKMVKEEAAGIWSDFTNLWMDNKVSKFERFFLFRNVLSNFKRLSEDICRGMLQNKDLLHSLRESQYDVVFSDPMMPCNDLMAKTLDIPHVISLRLSFAYTMERFCGQMPAPPSYVPAVAIHDHLTDRMSFSERIENMLLYIIHSAIFQMNQWLLLQDLYTELNGKPTTMCETMGKADIWLIRTYWDFEYPRPFLPNFKFVGGLHCKPAKPLPKELEAFVQSSGDHGIIVFSLGSMINNLTMERANTIASALGHPKTKAFITHGGTNGLYEAIYHGVPMVGLPLFADQPDNLMHMKTKGAAVSLDINTMESKDLPMKPLDQAVYWIEFVMRNKGAKHLRVQAHELSWYQYHCLDVLAFLLSITALITYLCVKTSAFLFRKCFRKTRPDAKGQKNKEE
ncbi:hypothetical protein DNTS_025234 [Danionella cerebrum]|uniref:UDP-glycosyltransferases domain-containing protein n=1 Tax=Danionella cerebrum TaxID=2873325 RepID=A0A553QSD4_9TELE|nr:hypothetical protein DNTS_025234 [Danionella translucida]